MQVRKIMTKNPACCTSDSTLEEVAHMMQMYDCGCIPVVDNHQTKRPIGTITDRDIAIRTLGANKNPMEMKASDIMTTDIVTVSPDSSVQECMDVMENKQIRRVLVVDRDGKCTGIVAQADLAEHLEQAARTGRFLREVSESDQFESGRFESNTAQMRDRDFESNRPQFNERKMPAQNIDSFSQRQPHAKLRGKKQKSSSKEGSFFNGTTLLTLLGSIGLGAGLKYYLGLDEQKKNRHLTVHKAENDNFDTKIAVGKKSSDMSLDTTTASVSATTSSSFPKAATATENAETIGGINSFDSTNDDTDLKPILEVGRTTSGT